MDIMNVWLPSLTFILGLLTIILEIFIFPGFGIAGLAGIILLGWTLLLVTVDIAQATEVLVLALVATIVIFVLAVRFLSRYNIWHKITLKSKQDKEDGYITSHPDLGGFLGNSGTALTTLRPSGTVEVGNYRLDVVTEGEYIAAGSAVEVIKVEGSRVVVRAVRG